MPLDFMLSEMWVLTCVDIFRFLHLADIFPYMAFAVTLSLCFFLAELLFKDANFSLFLQE